MHGEQWINFMIVAISKDTLYKLTDVDLITLAIMLNVVIF